MGDELVSDITNTLDDLCFANGVATSAARPLVDALVNRLRSKMTDETIRYLLVIEEAN